MGPDGYRLSTKKADMDIYMIHGFVSQSYWAKNIPLETMKQAVENSFCIGIFLKKERNESDVQVAFSRLVTDYATFAYLADVFVLPEHRGKGLSKWMMEAILSENSLQNLRRLLLATKDAQGLYRQFGFKTIKDSKNFMTIHNPNIYLSS